MQQVLISALVAAVICGAAFYVEDVIDTDDSEEVSLAALPVEAVPPVPAGLVLRYTEELVEDGWVNGARTTGGDNKPLSDASNSICYLTKIEIKGIEGAADANSCRIVIDEFTGFWEVIAQVDEGGRSEVRCNARCLVWEPAP